MSRSTTATERTIDVPELDVPELGAPVAGGRHLSTLRRDEHVGNYDIDFGDDDAGTSLPLELEEIPRTSGHDALATRFVAGIGEPQVPVSRFRSGYGEEPTARELAVDPTRFDDALEVVHAVPLGVWKRVPAYALLAIFLGNVCRCGGLSFWTNVALMVLVCVGTAGLCASLVQRRP